MGNTEQSKCSSAPRFISTPPTLPVSRFTHARRKVYKHSQSAVTEQPKGQLNKHFGDEDLPAPILESEASDEPACPTDKSDAQGRANPNERAAQKGIVPIRLPLKGNFRAKNAEEKSKNVRLQETKGLCRDVCLANSGRTKS